MDKTWSNVYQNLCNVHLEIYNTSHKPRLFQEFSIHWCFLPDCMNVNHRYVYCFTISISCPWKQIYLLLVCQTSLFFSCLISIFYYLVFILIFFFVSLLLIIKESTNSKLFILVSSRYRVSFIVSENLLPLSNHLGKSFI